MKQHDELPIEPLSEAAWKRVETGVFAELDALAPSPLPAPMRAFFARAPEGARRPSRLTLAWLAAAALALVLGATLVLRSASPARQLLASTRIVADAAFTEATLGDVQLRLERGAALVVLRDGAAGSLVMLERGLVHFAVPPRKERPFAVLAGEVTVEVVGTRFLVARSDVAVRVATAEGVVRVLARGRVVLLPAGAHWSSQAASPAPAKAPKSAASVPNRDASAARDAGSHEHSDRDHVAEPQPSTEPRLRFEQAALREADDPKEALRLYADLVTEGGRWGETALYAQARLEFELNHPRQAVQLLKRYLREHASGANASDVRTLLGGLSPPARPNARSPREPARGVE